MLAIKVLPIKGYKKVIEATDPEVGLHCFIAIHSSSLGPALGGTRIFPYATTNDALIDVLRLSKGMTYKSAIAETGTGGGKSVIIANPKVDKTDRLLQSFGQVVDSLQGEYIAAEDIGSTVDDMLIINQKTPYVSALPIATSSGDPSRFTAWGVFRGLQAVSKHIWKTASLRGKTIFIQGLGSVGDKVANILFWEGAHLILNDIDNKKAHQAALLYDAQVVEGSDIFGVKCDIFCPCAMGGILNSTTIPQLKCQAIAGAANNQLLDESNGIDLMKRNILYAPDFIINAGGLMSATAEYNPEGYHPLVVRDKVNHIYDTLLKLFMKAEKEEKPTNVVANEIAEHNLQHEVGKRMAKINFEKNRS